MFTPWYILLPAHLSFGCYVAAMTTRLVAKDNDRAMLAFRILWLTGAALLAIHSGLAFAIVHGGSHAAAYEHTAERTAELTGWQSGAGLYANEAMLALWLLDAAWALVAPASYLSRPVALDWSLHAFFAFMFFCATVVFGELPARVVGGIGFVVIGAAMARVAFGTPIGP